MIEVEANGEEKRGSSVIEVSQTGIPESLYIIGKGSTAPRAKGEAVFVDLGQGRNVVALLGYGPTASEFDRIAFLAAQAFDLDGDHAWRTLPNMQGRREVDPRLIPTLVTMPNVKDANSAIVVAPEDLPKVLGPDVRFLRASVELTKDPVTSNLRKAFPELAEPDNWPRSSFGSNLRFIPQYYMFFRG